MVQDIVCHCHSEQ